MGRPKEPPALRYRLKVPESDASVIAWMNAQSELSISLRLLIKEDIIRNGFTDVTCRPVGQLPKRGRPSNLDIELRETVVESNVEDDASSMDEKFEDAPPSVVEPVEQPVKAVASKPKAEIVKDVDAETGSRQDMITSMFSGGKRSFASKPSASAMGLLNDD